MIKISIDIDVGEDGMSQFLCRNLFQKWIPSAENSLLWIWTNHRNQKGVVNEGGENDTGIWVPEEWNHGNWVPNGHKIWEFWEFCQQQSGTSGIGF